MESETNECVDGKNQVNVVSTHSFHREKRRAGAKRQSVLNGVRRGIALGFTRRGSAEASRWLSEIVCLLEKTIGNSWVWKWRAINGSIVVNQLIMN